MDVEREEVWKSVKAQLNLKDKDVAVLVKVVEANWENSKVLGSALRVLYKKTGVKGLKTLEERLVDKGMTRRGFLRALSGGALGLLVHNPFETFARPQQGGVEKEDIARDIYEIMLSRPSLKKFLEEYKYGMISAERYVNLKEGEEVKYEVYFHCLNSAKEDLVFGFGVWMRMLTEDSSGKTYVYYATHPAPRTRIGRYQIENRVAEYKMVVKGKVLKEQDYFKKPDRSMNADALWLVKETLKLNKK